MTILTKSQLSFVLFLLMSFDVRAATTALSRYECLRDFMNVADRGAFHVQRKFFEGPRLLQGKYIVFPEVGAGRVTGFFLYDEKSAWYFDGVELGGRAVEMGEVKADSQLGVLMMTAQPNGLETVTVPFLPGFSLYDSDTDGPVALGSSVLPVVGAFVSRPGQRKISYYDPSQSTDTEVMDWLGRHTSPRGPAAAGGDGGKKELPRTLVKMVVMHAKTGDALWLPLKTELKIRRAWVQGHNLDQQTFKKLRRAMESSCGEPAE
jgi:hypothetical protein